MKIDRIILSDFRNFTALNLEPDAEINIFLGRNAQGKTNILEAIHFASLGISRAAKDTELIRWGENSAVIRLDFARAEVSHSLAIEISAERRRKILLDGNAIRLRSLIGRLATVMFSPEDLFMFKGAPAVRRKFLDAVISQASPVYFSDLTAYNRLVEQRNVLLKKIREGSAAPNNLELWNEQLAKTAAKILVKRLATVEKLNAVARNVQQEISTQAEELSISYDLRGLQDLNAPENFDADFLSRWYCENLRARNFSDVQRGSTSLGPHLDDLQFFLNGRELRQYGSQGQIRTTTLALKLSELQLLKSAAGEYPILLLDDVMSELDAARRAQLLAFLLREQIQTLITATEKSYFPAEPVGKIFSVEGGRIL
ncbi:MAG: DNA replication/repair protein RecF [Selenomonadaceae bacterium]|nr:DNA replication/repair protein RecF [Selenomonadaceae bacterium]